MSDMEGCAGLFDLDFAAEKSKKSSGHVDAFYSSISGMNQSGGNIFEYAFYRSTARKAVRKYIEEFRESMKLTGYSEDLDAKRSEMRDMYFESKEKFPRLSMVSVEKEYLKAVEEFQSLKYSPKK